MNAEDIMREGDNNAVKAIALIVGLLAVVAIALTVLLVTRSNNDQRRDIGVACVSHGGRWISGQCVR